MASHLQRPPDLPNCRKLWISAASAVCLTEKCHEKMDCEPSMHKPVPCPLQVHASDPAKRDPARRLPPSALSQHGTDTLPASPALPAALKP